MANEFQLSQTQKTILVTLYNFGERYIEIEDTYLIAYPNRLCIQPKIFPFFALEFSLQKLKNIYKNSLIPISEIIKEYIPEYAYIIKHDSIY